MSELKNLQVMVEADIDKAIRREADAYGVSISAYLKTILTTIDRTTAYEEGLRKNARDKLNRD